MTAGATCEVDRARSTEARCVQVLDGEPSERHQVRWLDLPMLAEHARASHRRSRRPWRGPRRRAMIGGTRLSRAARRRRHRVERRAATPAGRAPRAPARTRCDLLALDLRIDPCKHLDRRGALVGRSAYRLTPTTTASPASMRLLRAVGRRPGSARWMKPGFDRRQRAAQRVDARRAARAPRARSRRSAPRSRTRRRTDRRCWRRRSRRR